MARDKHVVASAKKAGAAVASVKPNEKFAKPVSVSVSATAGAPAKKIKAKKAAPEAAPEAAPVAVSLPAPPAVPAENGTGAGEKRRRKHRPGFHAQKKMREQAKKTTTILKAGPTVGLLKSALEEIADSRVILNATAATVALHFLDGVVHDVATNARKVQQMCSKPSQNSNSVVLAMHMCGFPDHVIREIVQRANEEIAESNQ